MRSRAERVSVRVTRALRVVAFVALAASMAHFTRARCGDRIEHAASPELPAKLVRWSRVSAPGEVQLELQRPPDGRERDWLAALAGAGTSIRWSAPALDPLAVSVEQIVDPVPTVEAAVAARAARVTLSDTIGPIDSAATTRGLARLRFAHSGAGITAKAGEVAARAAPPDSVQPRRVFVVGAAGWEGKFVVAALEERGWRVDAHLVVSPKGDVRQGGSPVLDTSRYSAVVAVDTTALRYADRIIRFVRQGGGLVLWSPASRGTLTSIAAGAAGIPVSADPAPVPDSVPRAALEYAPVVSLAPDAIVLERRGDHVTLAARRVGAGRVVETAFTNSWRWRMAGGADATERHREWLSALVSLVAYSPRYERQPTPSNPAPLAALFERLGAPSTLTRAPPLDAAAWSRWLFAVICAALAIEWTLRRLRGAR